MIRFSFFLEFFLVIYVFLVFFVIFSEFRYFFVIFDEFRYFFDFFIKISRQKDYEVSTFLQFLSNFKFFIVQIHDSKRIWSLDVFIRLKVSSKLSRMFHKSVRVFAKKCVKHQIFSLKSWCFSFLQYKIFWPMLLFLKKSKTLNVKRSKVYVMINW